MYWYCGTYRELVENGCQLPFSTGNKPDDSITWQPLSNLEPLGKLHCTTRQRNGIYWLEESPGENESGPASLVESYWLLSIPQEWWWDMEGANDKISCGSVASFCFCLESPNVAYGYPCRPSPAGKIEIRQLYKLTEISYNQLYKKNFV